MRLAQGQVWRILASCPYCFGQMLQGPDKKKVERVTKAFLQMKKFDIEKLKKAYEDDK
jgi:hypothetical protein